MAEEKVVVKPNKVLVTEGLNGKTVVNIQIKCPYCGEMHQHGFGTGHRVPHCAPGKEKKSDYYIDCSDFKAQVIEVKRP